MHKAIKWLAASVAVVALAAGGAASWYIHTKQPVRSGTVKLAQMVAPVAVDYDERGVPHIAAQNEADMYRALGFVHAQDRLFQMEMVRRLANGELAAVLGPKLLETDTLFRTLELRHFAQGYAAKLDLSKPSSQALLAYLDGVNQYQATHPAPMEFDLLGIPKREFTVADTVAVSGYLAYSFAAAFKTEPVMTFIRDQLGPNYLRAFDVDWHPQGVLQAATNTTAPLLTANSTGAANALDTAQAQADQLAQRSTLLGLSHLATLSDSALLTAGVAPLEGSNAWAISGSRTASGKPLLAGDPHIAYSAPAVWYEAHLSAPGFELYGHHQALNPLALLGHNLQFGWSLTMFQNDDIDLITEKINPNDTSQVWHNNQWVPLQVRTETIAVKGAAPVTVTLRRAPHGPIVSDVFKTLRARQGASARAAAAPDAPAQEVTPTTTTAMWWAFLETDNPILDAFYELNRADTRAKARTAAEKIHAPGLNVVWANARGDIGWWAAAKLPIRPAGVNPTFILDAAKGEAEKLGYYNFSFNPQEENPARGYIVSANHQPLPASGVPVPGYYNLSARAQRLNAALANPNALWDTARAQALQLDIGTAYGPRMLQDLMPLLKAVTTDPYEKAFLEPLEQWDGNYRTDSMAAMLFNQLIYEIAKGAMADELGPELFDNLLKTRAIDAALPRLVADPNSPWWDNVNTPAPESRFETLRLAWIQTLRHLESQYGKDLTQWNWGRAHTLTQVHPLGRQAPLDRVFNVGPFAVPGSHEVPNNLKAAMGPAPWGVIAGPSTRRVVDFADAAQARGINPLGQSGVLFDHHYDDQAALFVAGYYVPQHLSTADVAANAKSRLNLVP